MNCPVCNKSLELIDDRYNCDDYSELIHNFTCNPYTAFTIILEGIHIEMWLSDHWAIYTFNEHSDQELVEHKIAEGYNNLTPPEAYQLLLRYQKLLAFS